MEKRITRRKFIGFSLSGAGLLLTGISLRGIGNLNAAQARVDVGLIGPDTGPTPHTFKRVHDALNYHERQDGRLIFPEFDRKDLSIYGRDSQSKAEMASSAVQELTSDKRVQWLVSADVHSGAVKATAEGAKKNNTDCIFACDRMKLGSSNPHPFTWQILPDNQAWILKLIDLFPMVGVSERNDILVVGSPRSSFNQVFGDILSDGKLKGFRIRWLGIDKVPLRVDDLRGAIQRCAGEVEDPVFITRPLYEFVIKMVREAFRKAPLFVDATYNDPVDIFEQQPNILEPLYYVTLGSRHDPIGKKQRDFVRGFKEMDPVTLYGGMALQIIGHALDKDGIRNVDIIPMDSVGGIGVKFNDQGANVAASPTLLAVRKGTLVRLG